MGEDPAYGIVEGALPVKGDPLYVGVVPAGGDPVPLEEVRLLAPVIPRSKIIGIGRNYADHAKEMGNEVPAEPMMFLVPNTAVIGPARRSTTKANWPSSSARSARTSGRTRLSNASGVIPARTTSRSGCGSAATASGPERRASTRASRWVPGW
jgi:hypothetical protein